MAGISARILTLLSEQDGLGEAELSSSVFGSPTGHLDQLSQTLERLIGAGEIVRRGAGSDDEPYTYHLPDGAVPRL